MAQFYNEAETLYVICRLDGKVLSKRKRVEIRSSPLELKKVIETKHNDFNI
jgi:hypothetical protein